jgi:hypothetical protein
MEGPASEPEELGKALGENILAEGGREILEEVRRSADGE